MALLGCVAVCPWLDRCVFAVFSGVNRVTLIFINGPDAEWFAGEIPAFESQEGRDAGRGIPKRRQRSNLQRPSFRPNWRLRGGLVPPEIPNMGSCKLELLPIRKFVWLKVLKTSARNCRCSLSESLKFLKNE